MTHIPIGLIVIGLCFMIVRPEWTSVATLVVLSVLAVLVAAREAFGNGHRQALQLIAALQARDDERAAALSRLCHAQEKLVADARQMEERLSRLGAPVKKASL